MGSLSPLGRHHISDIRQWGGEIAATIAGSVGKTKGELILSLVQNVYPPHHSEVLFAEWMNENIERIPEACAELGIDPPKPGLGLYQRMKAVVMPALALREEE